MPRAKSPLKPDWVDPAVCSLEFRLEIIGRLPFFRHLSSAAIFEINRLIRDSDVAAGQSIYFEGDPGDHLYLVAIGKVRLIRYTATGREVLLDILHGGDYFGNPAMIAERGYAETAIAKTDCCILQISAQDFAKILAQHPDVAMKVLQAVGQRVEEFQEIIKQLSAYTVEQRVVAVLIRLAKKMGEPKRRGILIQFPLSRQDLAAMTATTVETVSRVMSRLSTDGLISSGRKWVAVNDLRALAELLREGALN
jgi:CRP-like cAMP-binding protein